MSAPIDYRISEEAGRRFAVVPLEQFTELMGRAGKTDALTLPYEIVSRLLTDKVTPARCWREYLSMTQAELASRLEVSQAQVAQWERPSAKLRHSTLKKLAAAMGIHVQQLALGDNCADYVTGAPSLLAEQNQSPASIAAPLCPPASLPLERGRGLIASVMPNPPPKTMANHLKLYDDEDNMLHGRELLEQMLVEMRQMATPPDSKPTATSMAADIGISMAQEALELATRKGLEPNSIGYKALLVAYLYGKLAMPRRSEHRSLLKHAIADMRRQTGFQSSREAKYQGQEWMREKATEIWGQDHDQRLRINDVAKTLQAKAQEEAERLMELGDKRPLIYWGMSLDTIRKNISKVAPDYARQPGRPRKT